ncbi:uncharacterized protein LOC134648321 [Cydia amplana]|uniref:uncharacterized protein LOC134648321 n=1 Tax=Cydia amplana TaxID=1869771 RepID=UPI002FE5B375
MGLSEVTLCSFNCRSIKRSIDDIRRLCNTADIIAIQEHWLIPSDLAYLNTISDEFACTGTSAVDTTAGMLRGRPYGGTALLWRKKMFPSTSVIQCDNVRISAINIALGDKHIIVFSVYMPNNGIDNLPDFVQCVSTMDAIVKESCVETVYLLGDFNAHPYELFCDELLSFCAERDWICADIVKLGIDSSAHTYLSEMHGSKRWLDHCVTTSAGMDGIVDVFINYDVYCSDHYPLVIKCNLNLVKPKMYKSNNCAIFNGKCVTWGERTSDEIEKYDNKCSELLKMIDFPSDLRDCCGSCCLNNSDHCKIIDQIYLKLISSLCIASVHSKAATGGSGCRKKIVIGWNKHVSDAHREARARFQDWVSCGKPNGGSVFDAMTLSRKMFKSKLRWVQQHQEQIKMDLLAAHHTKNDFRNFWKMTKKLDTRPGLSVSVEGISDPKGIANVFKDHFNVKPAVSPVDGRRQLLDIGVSEGSDFQIHFSADDVRKIIKDMKRGKSPGHDHLSIEHLLFAGPHLPRVLAMFFDLCICHSYLPSDLTKTIVVPIVKNKTGDISNRANYRPISLATIVARVLDGLLNLQLDKCIKLHDAQFGFRAGLSTESAIICLKQAVEYYTRRRTPVYACFLDLSKAFDLVNYDLLWNKLDEVHFPKELTRIFRCWYAGQRNCVRWGNVLSDEYGLVCGVRQGGLTSPKLFNLYIDALIGELSSTRVGCHIDRVCFNNISYADDMVLLSPSVGGLRLLIERCESYALA